MLDGLKGLFTVKVDSRGARIILEAHLKTGLKVITFLQSGLDTSYWYPLLTEGTDPKKSVAENKWLSWDVTTLEAMLKVLEESHLPLFGNGKFLKPMMLTKFLAQFSTEGNWIVAVDKNGLEILKKAGYKFEITPP